MPKEVSSAEETFQKLPHSIRNMRQPLILFGLSVTAIFVLFGLWWVQQNNVNAFQIQIDALKEKDKPGKLTPQQSLELQKDIASLEKDRITLANNVFGTLVQAIGGAALLAGLYSTWRNQNIAERAATNNLKSAQETLRLSQEGQVTERFTRAIDQLGNEKIEVRLGGIYALERIARDSPKDYWTIIEVLTSFVQEKSPLQQDKNRRAEEPKTQEEDKPQKITKDVQAVLTVIGRRDSTKDPQDIPLDLSAANLSSAKLIKVDLNGASLDGASLDGARLDGANLSRASLIKANLNEAKLIDAHLIEAKLNGASLIRADLSDAKLNGASLDGAKFIDAYLTYANLSGAKLSGANLSGAKLSKVDLSAAFLFEAKLSKADLSAADLRGANLLGANLSKVNLSAASLIKANLTGVDLSGADFLGAKLSEADLTGVDLREAKKLTPDQVKFAKNWEQAAYDDDFRKALGLSSKSD